MWFLLHKTSYNTQSYILWCWSRGWRWSVTLSPPWRGWEMLFRMEFSWVLILPSAAASRLSRAFLHQFVYPACHPRCDAAFLIQHATQQWLMHTAKGGLRRSVKLKKEMQDGVLNLISLHMYPWASKSVFVKWNRIL